MDKAGKCLSVLVVAGPLASSADEETSAKNSAEVQLCFLSLIVIWVPFCCVKLAAVS